MDRQHTGTPSTVLLRREIRKHLSSLLHLLVQDLQGFTQDPQHHNRPLKPLTILTSDLHLQPNSSHRNRLPRVLSSGPRVKGAHGKKNHNLSVDALKQWPRFTVMQSIPTKAHQLQTSEWRRSDSSTQIPSTTMSYCKQRNTRISDRCSVHTPTHKSAIGGSYRWVFRG